MPITSANRPTGAPGRPWSKPATAGSIAPASSARSGWPSASWCWRWTPAISGGSKPWPPARDLPADSVRMLREFDPDGAGDVPDPYYDTIAEFRDVRVMLERCMPILLDELGVIADGLASD